MSVHLYGKMIAKLILPLNPHTIMSFQLGCNFVNHKCQFSIRPLAQLCIQSLSNLSAGRARSLPKFVMMYYVAFVVEVVEDEDP